jgi:hypothetical protein
MAHAAAWLRNPVLVALAVLPAAALADSGIYVGGSVGSSSLDAGLGDLPGLPNRFNEDGSAYKGYLGYRLDLPLTFLGVEAGYVDFGKPKVSSQGIDVEIDTTATNLWGIAGVEVGPLEFFGKLGYVDWNFDYRVADPGAGTSFNGKDDGNDMGYGLGVAFSVGPVYLRGEYEKYDAGDTNLSMVSVGVSYLFD